MYTQLMTNRYVHIDASVGIAIGLGIDRWRQRCIYTYIPVWIQEDNKCPPQLLPIALVVTPRFSRILWERGGGSEKLNP